MITSSRKNKIHTSRHNYSSRSGGINKRYSQRRRSRKARHGYSGIVINLLTLHALPPNGAELSSDRGHSNMDAMEQWVHQALQFPDSHLSEQLLEILLPRFELHVLTLQAGGEQ
jgi:hypothetical protein